MDESVKAPICFCRFPAKHLRESTRKPHSIVSRPAWIDLRHDSSVKSIMDFKQLPSVLARIALFEGEGDRGTADWPTSADLKAQLNDTVSYAVRFNVYASRDLPPSDADGQCDAFVSARLGSVVQKTR